MSLQDALLGGQLPRLFLGWSWDGPGRPSQDTCRAPSPQLPRPPEAARRGSWEPGSRPCEVSSGYEGARSVGARRRGRVEALCIL